MANDRRESLNDIGVAMRAYLAGFQASLWTALPGYVTKYDPAKMTCEVQPTIQARLRDQFGNLTWVTMPLLVDCPVIFPSGGGFTLTFPIAAGDEVLVIFASRCIDSWWQSGGVQVQAELRMHNLSDGFALPSPRSQSRVLSGVSTSDVQLRSDDGTAFVSIDASKNIKVVSPGEADVTAPTINLTGNVNITGALVVSQTIVATGEITGAGMKLSHHKHTAIKSGNDTSGPPVNF